MNAGGREKGRLAVFSHPNLHKELSLVQSTEHSLSVALRRNRLSAVYLPASMTKEQAQTEMDKIPHSETTVGDMNCKFLVVNNTKQNKPADRSQILVWLVCS